MSAWNTFEQAEPELAARARATITATTNCVLGTLRADGSPRLSGIDPFFFDGQLLLGSMPNSRKAADLHRDPRMALHCIPWESRKVKDGATDPGTGDVKLTGRAVAMADQAEVDQIFSRYWADLGVDAPPGEAELFVVHVETVVAISVDGDELVIDRWSAADGRTVVRRT